MRSCRLGSPPLPLRGILPSAGPGSKPRRQDPHPKPRRVAGWREVDLALPATDKLHFNQPQRWSTFRLPEWSTFRLPPTPSTNHAALNVEGGVIGLAQGIHGCNAAASRFIIDKGCAIASSIFRVVNPSLGIVMRPVGARARVDGADSLCTLFRSAIRSK